MFECVPWRNVQIYIFLFTNQTKISVNLGNERFMIADSGTMINRDHR